MGLLNTLLALYGFFRDPDRTPIQLVQHWLTRELPLRGDVPRYIPARCWHCGSPLVHRPRPEDDGTYTDLWRCSSQWNCRRVMHIDVSEDRWKTLMSGWLDPDKD